MNRIIAVASCRRYSAEPGTPAHDTLRLLASWAATLDQDAGSEAARTADRA